MPLESNFNRTNAQEAATRARTLSYYLVGCCGTSLCCVGVVANLLSLAVLSKRSMRHSTTNMYLIALAFTDTSVLLMSLLVFLKDTRAQHDQQDYVVWSDFRWMPHVYIYSHAFNLLFQVASVWLTVAFTADRYLMICHPFLAERLCSRRLVGRVVAAVFVGSAIYSVPRFFEQELWRTEAPAYLRNMTKQDLAHLEIRLQQRYGEPAWRARMDQVRYLKDAGVLWYHTSSFGQSSAFRVYYHLVAWLLLVVLIPFASLAVMNAFLIRAVRRARRRINANEACRGDTTGMLIGVVLLFFVCQIPAALTHFIWSTKQLDVREGGSDSQEDENLANFAFQEVSNLLVVANSAINIVPYCLFSGRFRRELLSTLAAVAGCPIVAEPAYASNDVIVIGGGGGGGNAEVAILLTPRRLTPTPSPVSGNGRGVGGRRALAATD